MKEKSIRYIWIEELDKIFMKNGCGHLNLVDGEGAFIMSYQKPNLNEQNKQTKNDNSHKTVMEQMTFEEWKKAIEMRLLMLNSQEETEWFMNNFKDDLETYYKEDWEPNAVATAWEMGL